MTDIFDKIKLKLEKDSADEKVSTIEMYVSSEQNSYGAVLYQWFDGHIDPLSIKRSTYYKIHLLQPRRYEYIPGTCSDKSFFECVASKLNHAKSCVQDGKTCAPISLPGDHRQCMANQSECWDHIRNEVFPPCTDKKSCKLQEYGLFTYKYDLKLENEMMQAQHFIRNSGGNDEVVHASI